MGLSSHQRAVGASQIHLTPRRIIEALGPFDLDPCAAPEPRPWPTARRHVVEAEDGLSVPWLGRCWVNPPFDGAVVGRWVGRLADHGSGVLLVHARTETRWFRRIWEDASCILFLHDRISFCRPDGSVQEGNSGAPVVLAGFGREEPDRLARSGLDGVLVTEWSRPRRHPLLVAAE